MTPEDLVEIESIKQLKYKYMRCLDQKLWSEMAECFTEDASSSYSGGKYAYEGRDAILEFLEKSMGHEEFLSSHRVHHPEIQLTSATSATGVWALEDVVIDTRFDVAIRGAAFYEDEYVKQDGHWRIQSTGYKRTYEEMQNRKEVKGLKLTASWWGTGGKSDLSA